MSVLSSPKSAFSHVLSPSHVSLCYSDIRLNSWNRAIRPITPNFLPHPFPKLREVLLIVLDYLSMKDMSRLRGTCKGSREALSNICYDNSQLCLNDDRDAHNLSSSLRLVSRIAAETKDHSPGSRLSSETRKFYDGHIDQEVTLVKFRSTDALEEDDTQVVSLLLHSASRSNSSVNEGSSFSESEFLLSAIPDFDNLKTLALFRQRLSKLAFYSIQTRKVEALYLYDCFLECPISWNKSPDGTKASDNLIQFFFVKRLYICPQLSTSRTTLMLPAGLIDFELYLSLSSATQVLSIDAQDCRSLETM
jgi:hypothetical protein